MQIIHIIDDFLYTIFPDIRDKNIDELVKRFEEYYTYSIYKPKVSIKDGIIIIDIDSPAIISEEADYRNVVNLCEKGKFSDAKPILSKLIDVNPSVSEYHRIKGQILSQEGNQDEAINSLIDALKWDSKNSWALLMMGNIFAKYKNDIPTAMNYYDQAVKLNPEDNISLNNIGANLMNQGKWKEAENYFMKALKINDKYPNTHFALGMIAEMNQDLHSAFYSMIKSLKLNNSKDALYDNALNSVVKLSQKIISDSKFKFSFKEYLHKLEFESGKKIDVNKDLKLSTAAKIEIAEYHNRDEHIIKFNPDYPAYEHLIMHELVHLEYVLDARKSGMNQVFVSNNEQRLAFIKNLEPFIKKLKKGGFTEESIENFCTLLFNGMNTQVYNAPIDLFIENLLYTEFPDLRPYQFLSMLSLIYESIKAVTDKHIVENSPKDIVSKSKIYNIVYALLFKELYGVDLLKEFKATTLEMKQSNDFYDEFREYKDDKEPGEEYELVQHWAEDLKLNMYFDFVGEEQYKKRFNLNSFMESLENDPYGLEETDPLKEREMKKFKDSQAKIGTNMAVVMFMVDALQYFEKLQKEDIKNVALEIAMQGMHGYSPDKKGYLLRSIPDKNFSGYHILAYYYVSWSLAMPEMVSQLQLPYENEFILAKNLHNPNSK